MKKFTKVICAIVALVMILNTPPQIYAAEPPTDAEKTNLSATEKIEPIEPTPTDPDAKIYGIKLSQNMAFIKPGDSLQLSVIPITDVKELPQRATQPADIPISLHSEKYNKTFVTTRQEIEEYKQIKNVAEIQKSDTMSMTDYDIINEYPEIPDGEEYIYNKIEDCSPFEWICTDTEIATVSENGYVTALTLGSTVITVTTADGLFTAACEVIVVDEPLNYTNPSISTQATTMYSTPHNAVAIKWVNQYTGTSSDSTLIKMVTPGTLLQIVGKSGGFYYAKVYGETTAYYMWADGLYDRDAGNGYIEICQKGNSSYTNKHRDVFTFNTVELAIATGGSATWTSYNTDIATVSSSGVVTPKKEGDVCIVANQNGKKDAIHISIITKYTPTRFAIVNKNWCNQYRCSNVNCTIHNRYIGYESPNQTIYVYGKSGQFYYGRGTASATFGYFWQGNIALQTWFPHSELLKNSTEQNYFPQGFAVDNNYCYAFEIAVNSNHEEIAHKLYRYNISTGEQKLMTPQNAIGNLYHANDAALVTFNENGVNQQYLFVAAWSNSKTNYIVKLAVNSNGTYSLAKRYSLEKKQIVGITLLSGGGNSPATFLLKSGNEFFTATVPKNNDDTWIASPSSKFKIINREVNTITNQGIHYEPSTDKLYLAASGTGGDHIKNKVYMFSGIRNASGTIYNYSAHWNIDGYFAGEEDNATTFELEGIGFRPNQSDKRAWFSALDINTARYVKGVICSDVQNMR